MSVLFNVQKRLEQLLQENAFQLREATYVEIAEGAVEVSLKLIVFEASMKVTRVDVDQVGAEVLSVEALQRDFQIEGGE